MHNSETTIRRKGIRYGVASLLLVVLQLHWITNGSAASEVVQQTREDFSETLRPMLQRFCFDCHGTNDPAGELNLSEFTSWKSLEKQPLLMEKLVRALDKNEMPPEDGDQPTEAQRDAMLRSLNGALQRTVSQNPSITPLRMRRMNRFEYGNAVRDLFDLESWVYSVNDRIIRDHSDYFNPASREMPEVVVVGNRMMGLQQLLENRLLGVMPFPKDAPAENGFNNRGDHLSLTPGLMQSFLELSRSIVHAENFDENCRAWKDLFEDPANPRPAPRVVVIEDAAALRSSSELTMSAWIRPTRTTDPWQTIVRREDSWRRQLLAIGKTGDTWGLWMGAGISGKYVEFGAPVDRETLGDGEWHHVAGTFDGKHLILYVDGEEVGRRAIEGELYTQSRRDMEVGSYDDKETFHGGLRDILLYRTGLSAADIKKLASSDSVVAEDQIVGRWKEQESVRPILTETINEIGHQRIKRFLTKAFRAPVDEETASLYTKFFDKRFGLSGDFEASMKDVVSAALASPRFILVHNTPHTERPNQASYDLATRLSFFLWSSIPDDELLTLASDGKLQDDQVLAAQVDRMLDDRRVKNFCDSFAPQWLRINSLVSASPEFERHREYYFGGDDKISYKRGMHMMLEPLLNFETVFVENRPIFELVDSDFTYRSHMLTEWYQGRAAIYPINVNLRHIEFTRTELDDRRYGGVITTSAVAVMTSSPTRSLPIKRGAWISSVIFNDPPEPPPDNIPDLDADDETLKQEGLSIRQKLKRHRTDANCSGCHNKIDPLGFALENYDLLGRWRESYRTGIDVDASGKLFGKHEFQDVVGFKDAILAEEEVFAVAFIKHLLSYGLGRELTLADRIAAAEIAEASEKDGYRMRDIIRNIVLHPVFSHRGP